MKYQEQLQIAQEGVEQLNQGKTIDEFLASLEGKNIYQNDLVQIRIMLRKALQKRFGPQFQPFLLRQEEQKLREVTGVFFTVH